MISISEKAGERETEEPGGVVRWWRRRGKETVYRREKAGGEQRAYVALTFPVYLCTHSISPLRDGKSTR
jgi:hypothetical protein